MNDSKDNILIEEKKRKRLQLLQKLNPYPHQFKRTHLSTAINNQYAHLKAGESAGDTVFVMAGRLMRMRGMGKAAFFNVQDDAGLFQCYRKQGELDKDSEAFFASTDIGDIVGVKGCVFKTKKGELTLRLQHFQILCKSISPLPEKYHGLEDKELKYRRRYLQLIMDPESKKIFHTRSRIIQEIRSFLDQKNFLEVETPVLQPLYGGAVAEPFATHHRALDCKLYLKISPELYLKRLIVGGFDKVYEIGKNFRNEGVDRLHSPEFTMLEYYEAYTDYQYQMQQFEELVCHVVKKIKGSLQIDYQGKALDFTPPWRRLAVEEGIQKYADFSLEQKSQTELLNKLKQLIRDSNKPETLKATTEKALNNKALSRGDLIMEMFEWVAEPHLWQPVFITDFPKEVSPLTKEHRTKLGLVERFEPFIAGMELGNAYTELNDPVEQYERLKMQAAQRAKGGTPHPMDREFTEAINIGMPPTGGVGLGVERLVLILTNQASLKDIILFPPFKLHTGSGGKSPPVK